MITVFAFAALCFYSTSFVMRFSDVFFVSTAPILVASAALMQNLNVFVLQEKKIALQGVLDNIGSAGKLVPGAASGLVIASPSKVDPDYFYTWTRDSALTLKMLIDELIFGNLALLPTIENYVKAQAVLQTVSNPSGTLFTGAGLGEPKFLANGAKFTGAWGRPQRDGPALRAIALMDYCNWLILAGKSGTARTVVWPIVANDLSYVGQYWNQTGFDLWEEVSGSSFFTIQVQHRSLTQGAQLAQTLGVACTGCDQAPQLLCFLQSFWNGKHLDANINVDDGRSGLDANTILGSIAVFDIAGSCSSLTFQPCNSKSLATFKLLIDSFRKVYTINAGIAANKGVAVGRYQEDTYYGGNPWYLNTLAAAEFLYDAVAQWKAQGVLTIDETSLAFFKDLYPAASVRQYSLLTATIDYLQLTNAVTAYADSFVEIAQKYIPADGSLAEQFDRNSGKPLSAVDLTWSYASFVTMAERRSGLYPISWNSRAATSPPKTCAGTSAAGRYFPAITAGAPNITEQCTVNVHFNVNASTYFGENIYITGSATDLGGYSGGDNAAPLSATAYSSARPLWQADIGIIAGQTITYQYVRKENCGDYLFEDVERTLVIPACGQPGLVTDDAWSGPVGEFRTC